MSRSTAYAGLLTVLLLGMPCALSAVEYTDNEYPVPARFREAPMLRERVERGELPPVAQRLPDRPVVVGPGTLIRKQDLDWKVGRYGGGKLVGATSSPNNDPDLRDAGICHFLNTPKMQATPITGNVASSVKVEDDNKVFTITLRKGLKWSDGRPVTTEDVRFAWEDVMLNERVTPIIRQEYRSGGVSSGKPLKLEILDRYTFRLTSEVPYGGFLVALGVGQRWGGYTELLKPKHYLKKFHLKYTSLEEMRPILEKEGLGEQWWRLLLQKDVGWILQMEEAVDMPTLSPWIRVEGPKGRVVMERNPYYFKVDIAGNQLPYIDRYETVEVANVEMIPMKVISGECNILRIRCNLDKMPLYKKYEKRVGYRVPTTLTMHNAPVALFLNLTYDDPAWRKVVQDVRFRRAINLSIDREKIIEVFFFGFGKPSRWVPQEFDVDKAKKLLDEMGMRDRDGDGWREDPEGHPFLMPLVVAPTTTSWVGMMELLADGFRDLGLKTTMKTISANLIWRRSHANRYHATLDWLDTPNWDRLLMFDYLPDARCGYGRVWAQWKASGRRLGEKPPPWVERINEIYSAVLAARPDSPAGAAAAKRLRQWMHEQIPMFPIASDVMNPMIVPGDLGNFAHSGMASAAHFAVEQCYFLPTDGKEE